MFYADVKDRLICSFEYRRKMQFEIIVENTLAV